MLSVVALTLTSCSVSLRRPPHDFAADPKTAAPDYSQLTFWAAHPQKKDAADTLPTGVTTPENQANAKADVFFIYPTIFTYRSKGPNYWNADLNDSYLNQRIQQSTILYQATVFNHSCRVYAPYYRQAHLYAFFARDTAQGIAALDFAYQDVKRAFEYYLKNFNQGRPIVIASHSQGSYHAVRLLKEFFDDKPLKAQLVVAYLVGRPVYLSELPHLRPSETPEEIGVWASWKTFGRGFYPLRFKKNYLNTVSTNPLLWNSSEVYAPRALNKGGVTTGPKWVPAPVDAQNHQGLLWVERPHVRGARWLPNKNWHRVDMNLFYVNIRENVEVRLKTFLQQNPTN